MSAVLRLGAFMCPVRGTRHDLVEQQADVLHEGWLVPLDGEQVVGTTTEEILGQGALGEQGVGGEGPSPDIGQCLEEWDDGADLVGAFLLVVGIASQADFFWP